jgi:two-component system, chemotaxis family, chemotaxis protein CheY
MKVLVVDDDVVSRMVLMHLIDSCGEFDIVEAEDGEHAWQQLEQGLRPVICFCDLRMPRLSGMDLLGRVRSSEALRTLPFILVTSANDQGTVEQANGLGATGYIVKPFQVEQVRVHLAPFIDAAAPEIEAEIEAPIDAAIDAETPLATQQRLGINSERLLVYLGGFQSQLNGAGGEIDALLARGEQEAAQLRIDRLHAGCLTLGLGGAAAALKALAPRSLTSEQVRAALAGTIGAVQQQCEAVKRLCS